MLRYNNSSVYSHTIGANQCIPAEFKPLLTDEAVAYVLDYFAYILLEHPMMQANHSLSAEAAALRRLALYLDLPISVDRDPDLAALERHPLSQLRISKLKRQPAHAFVLLNPELLSMPELHAQYFATRPDAPSLSSGQCHAVRDATHPCNCRPTAWASRSYHAATSRADRPPRLASITMRVLLQLIRWSCGTALHPTICSMPGPGGDAATRNT